MSDELEGLIDGAASGESTEGAADAIISPELLDAVRASGSNRKPPTAVRPVEPASSDDDDRETDDGDDLPLAHSVPRTRSKYARFRKHEVEAEAERLAQENAELRASVEAAQASAKVDPNALRDLAFTIEFVATMGFKTAAIMRGPHWEISKPEAENIGDKGAIALGPMASEYAHMLPWINFAAALGQPIGMRIAEDRRIQRLQEIPPDAT